MPYGAGNHLVAVLHKVGIQEMCIIDWLCVQSKGSGIVIFTVTTFLCPRKKLGFNNVLMPRGRRGKTNLQRSFVLFQTFVLATTCNPIVFCGKLMLRVKLPSTGSNMLFRPINSEYGNVADRSSLTHLAPCNALLKPPRKEVTVICGASTSK